MNSSFSRASLTPLPLGPTREGPDCVLRVLAELEAYSDGTSGALVYGEDSSMSGAVLLENGRVCWAAAKGLRQRLTELLRQCCLPQMPLEEMEEVFLNCKRSGTPVGEALVALKRISPDALRSALLHHTAESLSAASSWVGTPRWVGHRARGYQSAYTFRSTELLSYASALACGQLRVDSAAAALQGIAGERDSAVFDVSGKTLLACRLTSAGSFGLRALSNAGRWAAMTLADLEAGSKMAKYTPDSEGGNWLGWRDGDATLLVHCPDREDFSRMLRALHLQGWSSVVKSSVALFLPGPPPTLN